MNVRPLHDRIVVQRLEEGEQRAGRIIIPDTAKEKPQQGTVVAAGNGRVREDGKRIALDVKAGDVILFGRYAGQEVELDGTRYLIMKEDEVLAVSAGAPLHRPAGIKAKTSGSAGTKAKTSKSAGTKATTRKKPAPLRTKTNRAKIATKRR